MLCLFCAGDPGLLKVEGENIQSERNRVFISSPFKVALASPDVFQRKQNDSTGFNVAASI